MYVAGLPGKPSGPINVFGPRGEPEKRKVYDTIDTVFKSSNGLVQGHIRLIVAAVKTRRFNSPLQESIWGEPSGCQVGHVYLVSRITWIRFIIAAA